MKGSTNEKLREIITNFDEGMKELRAEVRSCLGSIMGDISRIQEELAEIKEHTKPITVNMPKETKWIGYLCKFKDRSDKDWQHYDILEFVDYASTDGIFGDRIGNHWQECEIVKLPDPEVYKISQKDLADIGNNPDFIDSLQRFLGENKINDRYKVI